MSYKYCSILFLLILLSAMVRAQKPFTEGIITYKVSIESADKNAASITGTYTCIVKDQQIRKEIKMNNGYQDILIFNYGKNTVYSLQTKGDKKYAIQLKMDDFVDKQRKYAGFTLQNKGNDTKKIAGNNAQKAIVKYPDSTEAEIYYITDWYPAEPITFERFPGIKVLPLEYTYTSSKGVMHFHAETFETKPVENAAFYIPADYKMISYTEYQQLSN